MPAVPQLCISPTEQEQCPATGHAISWACWNFFFSPGSAQSGTRFLLGWPGHFGWLALLSKWLYHKTMERKDLENWRENPGSSPVKSLRNLATLFKRTENSPQEDRYPNIPHNVCASCWYAAVLNFCLQVGNPVLQEKTHFVTASRNR